MRPICTRVRPWQVTFKVDMTASPLESKYTHITINGALCSHAPVNCVYLNCICLRMR